MFGARIEWNGRNGKPPINDDELIIIEGGYPYGTYIGHAGNAIWDYLTSNFYLRENHPWYDRSSNSNINN